MRGIQKVAGMAFLGIALVNDLDAGFLMITVCSDCGGQIYVSLLADATMSIGHCGESRIAGRYSAETFISAYLDI